MDGGSSIGLQIFYKEADGYALLNGEDILVPGVRRGFQLLVVAMQVEDVDVVEAVREAAAHAAKGGIIQVAVAGDEGEDALSCPVELPLCETQEFDIVIAQPFRLRRFLQFWASFFVGFQQFRQPFLLVGRMPCIGGIAQNYRYGRLLKDVL